MVGTDGPTSSPDQALSLDFNGFQEQSQSSVPMEICNQSQDSSALDFDTNIFSVVLRSENDSPPQRGMKKIKERQAYDYQANFA